MTRSFPAFLTLLLTLGIAAQEQTTAESPLDDLLATPISTAAKYEQRLSEVPASVTVISAEEIQRYGWHTLGDVLGAVRGVYTSYDRGYTYLGVRGIGLPSDYNNRFLVLIDGHPMVEAVSGSIGIGTTLALDLSLFSRIEFVRGPSSVMYGTGAMFGVINLITKNEQERASLIVGGGSGGQQFGSARSGFRRGSVSGSVAVTWQESNGKDIHFSEFDAPATNGGVARDRDYDDYRSILATFHWRDLHAIALQSTRTKGIPTASWETTFGQDERISEGRTLLGLRFARELAPGNQISARAHFDRFRSYGDYPYGDPGEDVWSDQSVSTRTGAEMQYVRDLRPNHRLTVGGGWNRVSRASYRWGNALEERGVDVPFSVTTLYAQHEWQPLTGVTLTLGGSFDHHSAAGNQFTPRAAAIWTPSERTTMKLLAGRGYRRPSVYEEFFEPASGPEALLPETIRTLELVWERRLTPDILLTGSLFNIQVERVLRHDLGEGGADIYRNAGEIRSNGIEVQTDYRHGNGVWSYVSYSWQRAAEGGYTMPNSPEHLVKGGISTPSSRPLQGALELQYGSGRRTLAGATARGALVANANVTVALTKYVSAALIVRNLLGTEYALPGGPEHVQDTITQDGRTFAFRLVVRGR